MIQGYEVPRQRKYVASAHTSSRRECQSITDFESLFERTPCLFLFSLLRMVPVLGGTRNASATQLPD